MEERKTSALYQKRDGKWYYCTLWGRQRYLGKNLDVASEKLKGFLEGSIYSRILAAVERLQNWPSVSGVKALRGRRLAISGSEQATTGSSPVGGAKLDRGENRTSRRVL